MSLDNPDVYTPLRRVIKFEAPFAPACSWFARIVRRGLRALHLSRPWSGEVLVQERSLEHVVDYLGLMTLRAKAAVADRPLSDDIFDSLRGTFETARTFSAGTNLMLVHVTGINDVEFWDSVSPTLRQNIIYIYEQCNPTLVEYKKKLDSIQELIHQQRVRLQAERMIRTAGETSSTPLEPDTESTPASFEAPGPFGESTSSIDGL